jgi:hypothetical protein
MHNMKGWMSSQKMKESEGWLKHWTIVAEEAEKEGFQLVIYAVPTNAGLEEEIDEFIHNRIKETSIIQ